jgi:ABC-type branched-subunit amino acid transport system permease subunit
MAVIGNTDRIDSDAKSAPFQSWWERIPTAGLGARRGTAFHASRRKRLHPLSGFRLDVHSRHDRVQSLMFLAGYGGMVSLIQMSVAAMAGYMVAIFGVSGITELSLGMPWWINIPLAILIATIFGTLVGALAVRTEGIYTIMITLAIASAFFYFTRQNYTIFNGYTGFNLVVPPQLFGVDWRQPMPFYYLTLGCAFLAYIAVVYVSRAPFGLALQGVRDNPRRMAALGYNIVAHRIAAYAFASVIAAVGGICWSGRTRRSRLARPVSARSSISW